MKKPIEILDKKSFSKKELKSNKNLPNEQWFPIKGYEGLYEISNYIRVRSYPKISKDNRKLNYKILAIEHNKTTGVDIVLLNDGTKRKKVDLEDLVRQNLHIEYSDDEKNSRELETIKLNKQKNNIIKKRSKYILYNIKTGEKKYYINKKTIYDELNIPIEIIDRLISNRIPYFLNYKIYIKERGSDG